MEDYMIRGTGAHAQVRIFAASTAHLVEEARERHNLSPVACAALGRLMTGGVMMGSMLKGEHDKLTLQIKCSGPIGGLTVTADALGHVKGMADHPDVMLPPNAYGKLDVGGALDLGVLSVIRDMGLKEPYVGQTQLVSGEIAEDLAYYFTVSEQVNSSVALGVRLSKENHVASAGGFIVQLMPFAEEDVIAGLERNIGRLPSVTQMLESGMTPEDIAGAVMEGMDFTVSETMPVSFYCDCSRERVEKVLISMGRDELLNLIREGEPVELNCHFCSSHYLFSTEELKKLLERI